MLNKSVLYLSAVLAALFMSSANAASSFQYTCSNIGFSYVNADATLQAVCLRSDGTPHSSTLVLKGISNQNGKLVQGGGSSTFQQSCGSIEILVAGGSVKLAAMCRTRSGSFNSTTLALNGISNNNGTLTY